MSNLGPLNPPKVFTGGTPGLVPNSAGGTTNFLRADGSFAAPGGGGGSYSLIGSVQTLVSAAPTIPFTSIPQTFNHLVLEFIGYSAHINNTDDVYMQFNGDTGANYVRSVSGFINNANVQSQSIGSATEGILTIAGNDLQTYYGLPGTIKIPWYTTAFLKAAYSQGGGIYNPTGAGNAASIVQIGFAWANQSAITSILLGLTSGSNFQAGTKAALYGIL